MMHALIEHHHGRELAIAADEWNAHNQIREDRERQRSGLRERFRTHHPTLLRVIERMEKHIEEPQSRQALAKAAGLSVRQLERLFRTHLGTTLGDQYLAIRLNHAVSLLRRTAMPVLDIAVACGFVSASHFSRAYKKRYGQSPRAERRILAAWKGREISSLFPVPTVENLQHAHGTRTDPPGSTG